MKKIFSFLISLFLFSFFLFSSSPVKAQGLLGSTIFSASFASIPKISLINLTRFSSLEEVIEAIPYILLGLVGIFFILVFLLNGYKYMTSLGKEEQAKEAKGGMTNAIVGLLIALAASAIIKWIQGRL